MLINIIIIKKKAKETSTRKYISYKVFLPILVRKLIIELLKFIYYLFLLQLKNMFVEG